jgi:TRAP-type mannitol/chloroaromatic compound transport system permease large subunit
MIKIRKELWFGFTIMAMIVIPVVFFTPWTNLTNGSLGLLMLGLVVVAIMLGFPTAFTLMGMGVLFSWFFYRSVDPDLAVRQVLDLMVQRAYGVMSNDVLIAVPLFVFMGYLVERAALIERLFKSLHLSMARVPGSLAVATIVTCAIFATATGIVGAVVTLMGLLAMPAMLRAGYNTKIAAGAITAGGCLGILIPPSVLLIVYGATAGVSVVQLYAGAFFPGIMLAGLYVGYVIVIALIKPNWMPPLPEKERFVALPAFAEVLQARGRNALLGLGRALGGAPGVPSRTVLAQLFISLLPALAIIGILAFSYNLATRPVQEASTAGLVQAGGDVAVDVKEEAGGESTGLQEPPAEGGGGKPAEGTGLQEPPTSGVAVQEPPAEKAQEPVTASVATPAEPAVAAERLPVPTWYWVMFAIGAAGMALLYWLWSWQRLEIFKMLLGSFFPLAVLILSVLGSIVAGLATPTEAAAVGAFGGLMLAAAYRFIAHQRGNPGFAAVGTTVRELGSILKESSFLTAKTSAMVCWLFVGSAIFSAAFALLGGQEIIERWVLSLGLTPIQFMILAQCIIFILGWPLEWTEIIVIFMPIFIPLLPKFGIDPLFFGLLVALNLQTAFLSPPVAMAAFYLKGVAPRHVTLNQIFLGMMPFMVIQVIALVLLYMFPGIGLWLPQTLYK